LRIELLEDRCLPSGLYNITEYPLAPGGFPLGITSGPDGNLWFAIDFANQIGQINPTTGAVKTFNVPTLSTSPRMITSGPDGNLYFTETDGDKIGRINPKTGAIKEFDLPTANTGPFGITTGPDGNIWFTEAFYGNQIGRFNPATKAFIEIPLPTANSQPLEITTGPDGNLWFTESSSNKIGEINPTTLALTEFNVPKAASGPGSITAAIDGDLWFTEGNVGRIGRITTVGVFTGYDIPNGAEPAGITQGPDGNLWFGEFGYTGYVGEVDLSGQVFHAYATPTSYSGVNRLTTGPDGNIWFTESYASQIGQLTIPVAATGKTAQLVANQRRNVKVATFRDLDLTATTGDFTATIHWGDGTSSTATITQPGGPGTTFNVKGTHSYTAPGTYHIGVDIDDIRDDLTILTIGTANVKASAASPDILAQPFAALAAAFASDDWLAGSGSKKDTHNR
jgi:streptogramin lyase